MNRSLCPLCRVAIPLSDDTRTRLAPRYSAGRQTVATPVQPPPTLVERRKTHARRPFRGDRPPPLAARRQRDTPSRSCPSTRRPRVSPRRSQGSVRDARMDPRLAARASCNDSDRVGAPPPVSQLFAAGDGYAQPRKPVCEKGRRPHWGEIAVGVTLCCPTPNRMGRIAATLDYLACPAGFEPTTPGS